MTVRQTTLLLWAALLVAAPVPFFLVEIGRQSVASLVHMLGWLVALLVAEGSGGAIVAVIFLVGLQALLAAGLLALLARGAALLLARAFGLHHGRAALALAAALLLLAATLPVYVTPFRTTGLQSTLPESFE